MVGIFAELENNMRRERQIGIRRGIDNGAKFGRKSKLNDVTISAISSMRDEGQSIRKIAKELNLGVGTVHKACSEMVVQNNEVATA